MFYTIEKSLKVYFTMFVLLYQLHKSNKFTNKQTQINQNSDKKILQWSFRMMYNNCNSLVPLTKDCSTVCNVLQNITSSKLEVTFQNCLFLLLEPTS